MNPLFGKAYQSFCKLLFSIYCPLSVQGKENLPDSPFIFCSNHCSHLDTPALMIAAGLPFHEFGMMAAKDYFFDNARRKKFVSLFMRILPMERKPNRTEIANNIELCRALQCNLILYPEGTRSKTGELQKLKKGAAYFAQSLHMPLVPVHIRGTFESMPKGRSFPLPKRISVTIGKPVYVKEEGLLGLREATQELENRIRQL